ncbi:hypothetical protein [Spiroplasma endosymbiont of Virgichneumon dumeticola]
MWGEVRYNISYDFVVSCNFFNFNFNLSSLFFMAIELSLLL